MEFNTPRTDIGFLVKLIYDAVDRSINDELKDTGLTHSQLSVLDYLSYRKDRRTTITDIAEDFCIKHPTSTGLVNRMEQNGFVETVEDSTDKRARLVKATNKFDRDTSEVRIATEAKLLKGFTEEERRALSAMLVRVYENIK
ncbi:MAG: MarR family transcriptional regulator [Clostridia bacterium]|nr:MarR family transcriptional regulator [Clostridia bacterium]